MSSGKPMNTTYQVYSIRHIPTDKFYINVCMSKSTRMINYILREYKQSNKTKYTTIGKLIDENSKNVSFCKLDKEYSSRHDAEEHAYTLQKALQEKDRLLNDFIIDPVRERCSGCGYMIRSQLMEQHLKDKCNATSLGVLQNFI